MSDNKWLICGTGSATHFVTFSLPVAPVWRPECVVKRLEFYGPDLKPFADTREKRVPVSLLDPGKPGKQTNHTCGFGLLTADN